MGYVFGYCAGSLRFRARCLNHSPLMSITSTLRTFKQIDMLHSLMLNFVQLERRDFQPSFDIVVVGMDQCQLRGVGSQANFCHGRYIRPGKDDTSG